MKYYYIQYGLTEGQTGICNEVRRLLFLLYLNSGSIDLSPFSKEVKLAISKYFNAHSSGFDFCAPGSLTSGPYLCINHVTLIGFYLLSCRGQENKTINGI